MQDRKEVGRNSLSDYSLCRYRVQAEFSRTNSLCGEHVAPRRGYSAELLEEGIGITEFAREVASGGHPHEMEDFLRVLDRQRSPERGVEKGKDGSVCPYSECQRQHDNSGEAGRPAEHAGGEAQILPARLHKRFPAG